MKNILLMLSMMLVLLSVQPAISQSAATDSAKGHEVFERWCADCHNRNPALQKNGGGLVGSVFAGTYTLEQRYKGAEPAALEDRTDLTPTFIKYTVRHGLNMMPRSRKTEITDADLDALVAYLTQRNH